MINSCCSHAQRTSKINSRKKTLTMIWSVYLVVQFLIIILWYWALFRSRSMWSYYITNFKPRRRTLSLQRNSNEADHLQSIFNVIAGGKTLRNVWRLLTNHERKLELSNGWISFLTNQRIPLLFGAKPNAWIYATSGLDLFFNAKVVLVFFWKYFNEIIHREPE
jgi:hypothetical protein